MSTLTRRSFLAAGTGVLTASSGCLLHCPDTLPLTEAPRPTRIVDAQVQLPEAYDPAHAEQETPAENGDERKESNATASAEAPRVTSVSAPSVPERFLAVAMPAGVRHCVLMATSPEMEDTRRLLELAEKNACTAGVIGRLSVGDLEFRGNFDLFAENPLFCGIRMEVEDFKDLSLAKVDDLRHVARKGLTVETLCSIETLPEVVKLAEAVPDLRLVIRHLPFDPPTSVNGRRHYERALVKLATRPNVFAKLSAVVKRVPDEAQQADTYRSRLDELWNLFGDARVLFGSDWPHSEAKAPYGTIVRVMLDYLSARPPVERERFFWRNSRVVYDWKEREGG